MNDEITLRCIDRAKKQHYYRKGKGDITMMYLGMIFFQIVAPILVLLVLGAVLQKKFHFNLKALSQLITYCFMPAAVL